MKKIIAIALTTMMAISLAACGGSSSGSAASSTAESKAEEAAATDGSYGGGEYKLVINSHVAKEELCSVFMDNFCDLVEAKSDGKITFDRYYSAQIANQAESAEGVKTGSIDIAMNDWPSMSSVNGYAKGDVMALGYLFKDYNHVKAFEASDAYKTMCSELIDQVGVRCLAPGASGFRQVYSKDSAKAKLEDFDGFRIRVPDIAIYVNTFQALKCATTIVANNEVYTALQTGIVDGVENPAQGCYNMSWYEQLKYINMTNHIFCDIDLFMNEAKFQSMDAEAQQILLDCAAEASATNMEQAEALNDEFIAKLVENGMEIVEVDTDSLVSVMKEQVWPTFYNAVDNGEAFIEDVLALG